MSVNKMKRLSLAALRNDRDRLLRELVWLSSVEVSELDAASAFGSSSFLPAEHDGGDGRAALEEKLRIVREAAEAVGKYRKKNKNANRYGAAEFERLEEKLAGALENAQKVCDAVAEKEKSLAISAAITRELDAASPWAALDVPVRSVSTRYTRTVTGTLPAFADIGSMFDGPDAPDAYLEQAGSDGGCRYVTVTYFIGDEQAVGSVLSRSGFVRTELEFDGTPALAAEDAAQREKRLCADRERIDAFIESAAVYGDDFDALADYYEYRLDEERTGKRMLCTQNAVLMTGWVPVRAVGLLERTLADFDCCYSLDDPSPEDDVPVELSNGPLSTPFEQIIALYAYPQYSAFDPTRIMAFFYFFIFGLMIADIGYGLLMTFGCLAFMKIKRARGAFAQMLKMFALCGISTTLAGVLYGSFFGDLLPSFAENMLGFEGFPSIALWFEPLNDPMTFLYISLAIGGVQVLAGMAVNAYMKIKRGDAYGALIEEGAWFLMFGGGGLYVAFGWTAAVFVALAGLLIMVLLKARGERNPILRLGKGLLGLYGIVNYASDILSYSRIMALGLSGAVVANVMNLLATIGGPNILGILLFVIVLPIGTVLNLAISVLGAFVHTARLQYIEFFGKFYEEGGRHFEPYRVNAKHVSIVADEKYGE